MNLKCMMWSFLMAQEGYNQDANLSMMKNKGIRIGIVTAVVVVALTMLAQCHSNHKNAKGTSMMVEVSEDAIKAATEKEFDEIMSRCCEVMEDRIQLFCEEEPGLEKAKFSVKKLSDHKSIRIDFTNLKLSQEQVARVLKLLQSHGCLQFYETYCFNELYDCFFKANEKLSAKYEQSDIEDENVNLNGPLSRIVQFSINQEKFSSGWNAFVGTAQVNDTAAVNQMLFETSNYFPRDLKFAWTVKPIVTDNNEALELVALKMSKDNKCALDGEIIKNARQEYSSITHDPEILIEMNNEGAMAWKQITGRNIGKQIAVVFDGYVYSYPIVAGEIPNGRSSISGANLTAEEAKDLANILNAGMLPITISVNVITNDN